MKIAYFDAGSGISGDMTVGALLDSGSGRLTVDRLRAALSSIDLEGYSIDRRDVLVGSLRASSFSVTIEGGLSPDGPHGHGSHGHEHSHEHGHGHDHEHHHDHRDEHSPGHGSSRPSKISQPRRDWKTIRAMIERAGERGLAAGTVERSLAIFGVLAAAEGRVHGVAPDDVHFHEVGAVDSIVDIVSTAWCLDELAIEQCFVGPLPSGSGYVTTEHGRLPVPAPATADLLRGFEIVAGDGQGELVTPTGAAILAALAKPMRPGFRLESVGIGAGTRRLTDRPNVLRVLVGECDARSDEQVAVMDADVDDMTPAALAHVAERLRDGGARDVTIVPTVMKKGRAGMRLTVVCDLADLRALAGRMLAESSTIGVRYRVANRIVLPRRIDVVETELGPIALKVVSRPDGEETAEPELDDIARAAIAHDKPLAAVRDAALSAWRRSQGR